MPFTVYKKKIELKRFGQKVNIITTWMILIISVFALMKTVNRTKYNRNKATICQEVDVWCVKSNKLQVERYKHQY